MLTCTTHVFAVLFVQRRAAHAINTIPTSEIERQKLFWEQKPGELCMLICRAYTTDVLNTQWPGRSAGAVRATQLRQCYPKTLNYLRNSLTVLSTCTHYNYLSVHTRKTWYNKYNNMKYIVNHTVQWSLWLTGIRTVVVRTNDTAAILSTPTALTTHTSLRGRTIKCSKASGRYHINILLPVTYTEPCALQFTAAISVTVCTCIHCLGYQLSGPYMHTELCLYR